MSQFDKNIDATNSSPNLVSLGKQVLEPGTVVSQQFRVEEKVGDGGMGSVFKCTDLWLGRAVAVKFLHPHLAYASNSLLRFRQEAKAVALLNHSAIVKVHQLSFEGDAPFIVMDFVQAKSLSEMLKQRGRLPIDTALFIMLQVADALQHAHENGVVHRDLKPSNILVATDTNDVKVVDFGIAKIVSSDEPEEASKLTQTGELFGTPAYMCPEQLRGEPVDGRADQYSFGCVLFECLTGAPPFTGKSIVEVIMRHVNDKPSSLREASLGVEFPDWLELAVSRMIEKRADARFPSMLEVKQALENIAEPEVPAPPEPPPGRPAKKIAVVSTVVATVAACIFAAVSWPHKPHQVGSTALAPASVPVASSHRLEPSNYISQNAREDQALANSQFTTYVLKSSAQGRCDSLQANNKAIDDDALLCLNSVPRLTSLDLGQCAGIDDKGMERLLESQRKQLFDLRWLSIHSTSVSNAGLELVSQMPTLTSVFASQLSDVNNQGVFSLAKLPNLTKLSLEGDAVNAEGLSALKNANNLTWLNVRGCDCHDAAKYFTKLKLEHLNISGAHLMDSDMDEIAKISTLKELDISGNNLLSDHLLDDILKLRHLTNLSLSANNMSPTRLIPFLKKVEKRIKVISLNGK